MVSLIAQVDAMAGLKTPESAGSLPGVVPYGISALSHVKVAHRIWKRCTKIELIANNPKLAMSGVVFEEGKVFLGGLPLIGSVLTNETAANWVVRTELVAMSVVRCMKQKKAVMVAYQHLKDAVQFKKELPVGFRDDDQIEPVASPTKGAWLFSPSTAMNLPNNIKILAWRVGQVTECSFWLIVEGVKLVFCYLDVKDALETFHSDEKLKDEKQYIFVYASVLYEDGWQIFQTTFNYIKEKNSEQYSELKTLNVDSVLMGLTNKILKPV